MHSDRRRGIRKPNAQQSLLEGAATARRAERRRLAGLSQQGGDGGGSDHAGSDVAAETLDASAVAWIGCQWLMEGYCGRAEEAAAVPRRADARQEQQGGDAEVGGQANDGERPRRSSQAA